MTIGGIWLSLKIILNPEAYPWLAHFAPPSDLALDQTPLQSLDAIQADIREAGFTPGETALLESASGGKGDARNWLLPVLAKRSHCQTQCNRIVELRVYRPQSAAAQEPLLKLVDRLPIAGPEEAFVVAPFVGTAFESPGSPRPLPLTQLRSLPNGSNQGMWLTLQGRWNRGNTTVLYGQLIRYHPSQARLSLLLSWTSPAGKYPYWQELDGAQPAELMVDQTVGLHPQFRAYRLERSSSTVSPLQLRPISFAEPALNQPLAQSTYGKALLLARNGLWSAALQTLQSLKQDNGLNWTTDAEAQLQLIRHHAEITKAQADRTWASPRQQLMTYLIDGQWDRALDLFETEAVNDTNGLDFLNADSSRLWNQVSIALRTNPNQPAVQTWGALLLSAQQTPSDALDWLTQQPNSAAIKKRFNTLMTPLTASQFKDASASAVQPQRIIGFADQMRSVDLTPWFSPQAIRPSPFPDQAAPDQAALDQAALDQAVWYRIQVAAFHDGQQWRRPPFSNRYAQSAGETGHHALWRQLGFDKTPDLEILVQSGARWHRAMQVQVKALQLRGEHLWLLASGRSMLQHRQGEPLLLAMSPKTLGRPSRETAITLATLKQRHPQRATQIISTFQHMLSWRDGSEELISSDLSAPLNRFETALNSLSVQLIDLTGDRQPEALLTLSPTETATILGATAKFAHFPPSPLPRTLIFSATGELLYSDLNGPDSGSGGSLIALAPLSPGKPIALVVQTNGQFQLWEWSRREQRFQP